MIEAWIGELMRECLGKRDKEVIDANVRFACDLHAHNLLLFRTAAAGELDADAAQTLACGIVYLQTRHKWNMRLLAVPETEVFELLQTQRRNLVGWLRGDGGGGARAAERAEALEAVVRVTAGSGLRVARAATDEKSERRWAAIQEDVRRRPRYTAARFTLSSVSGFLIAFVTPAVWWPMMGLPLNDPSRIFYAALAIGLVSASYTGLASIAGLVMPDAVAAAQTAEPSRDEGKPEEALTPLEWVRAHLGVSRAEHTAQTVVVVADADGCLRVTPGKAGRRALAAASSTLAEPLREQAEQGRRWEELTGTGADQAQTSEEDKDQAAAAEETEEKEKGKEEEKEKED